MWSLEALWLILASLYVVESFSVGDPNDVVIVGWRPGTARLRTGVDVWIGRHRTITWGRLLPPLHPPLRASGSQMDAKSLAVTHGHLSEAVRPLRALTHVLFVALFVLLPGSLLAPSGWFTPGSMFGLIAGCWVAVAVATVVARRRMVAGDGPRPGVAVTLLSPVSAIRALDALASRALAAWHPVVVAQLLCTRDDYLSLARVMCLNQDAADSAAIAHFLRGVGDWEAVHAPPELDCGCRSFCPACHAQFRNEATMCPDCAVSLKTHPAADTGAAGTISEQAPS